MIALQGRSPLQVQLAHVLTGEPLGVINLPGLDPSAGGDSALVPASEGGPQIEEPDAPKIEEAYFSHSSEAGWCLVVILTSGTLLLADVSSGGVLARVQCRPHETFHSLALLGRVYALVVRASPSLWCLAC